MHTFRKDDALLLTRAHATRALTAPFEAMDDAAMTAVAAALNDIAQPSVCVCSSPLDFKRRFQEVF